MVEAVTDLIGSSVVEAVIEPSLNRLIVVTKSPDRFVDVDAGLAPFSESQSFPAAYALSSLSCLSFETLYFVSLARIIELSVAETLAGMVLGAALADGESMIEEQIATDRIATRRSKDIFI